MKKLASILMAAALLVLTIPAMKVEAAYPKLMLTGYALDEEQVVFGQETKIKLGFTNMSKVQSISEILITYTSPTDTVFPSEGKSNQIYIPYMDPEEVRNIELPVVLKNDGTGYAAMNLKMVYTGESGTLSNESYIMVPVNKSGSLSITSLSIPPTIVAGQKASISGGYYNDGTQDLNDVAIEITDSNGSLVKSISIGDVSAGKNGYFEDYVVVTNPGNVVLNVSCTFRDETGRQNSSAGNSYDVLVVKQDSSSSAIAQQGGSSTDGASSAGISTTMIMLIGVVAVLTILCIVMIVVNRKKK